MKILVVEDDEVNASALALILSNQNYTVEVRLCIAMQAAIAGSQWIFLLSTRARFPFLATEPPQLAFSS